MWDRSFTSSSRRLWTISSALGGLPRLFSGLYSRSARTIRRFSKVGIGVHVCRVSMSLPFTSPITHDSVGSARKTSLTLYSYTCLWGVLDQGREVSGTWAIPLARAQELSESKTGAL